MKRVLITLNLMLSKTRCSSIRYPIVELITEGAVLKNSMEKMLADLRRLLLSLELSFLGLGQAKLKGLFLDGKVIGLP